MKFLLFNKILPSTAELKKWSKTLQTKYYQAILNTENFFSWEVLKNSFQCSVLIMKIIVMAAPNLVIIYFIPTTIHHPARIFTYLIQKTHFWLKIKNKIRIMIQLNWLFRKYLFNRRPTLCSETKVEYEEEEEGGGGLCCWHQWLEVRSAVWGVRSSLLRAGQTTDSYHSSGLISTAWQSEFYLKFCKNIENYVKKNL